MHPNTNSPLDVAVVGGGFGGLCSLYRLRKDGRKVRLFEAGSDVGGVWFWNRYPGLRCDVPSMEYSFSFDSDLEQEWKWPEVFSDGAAILSYLRHVADRFGLRKHIQFNARVTAAHYDEPAGLWRLIFDDGSAIASRFVILATGVLSKPNIPFIDGVGDYSGDVVHTASWPEQGVDLRGKRVVVIGTGSSGVQCIPVLAREASELVILQRSANFTLPAINAPMEPFYENLIKDNYATFRARARMTRAGIYPRYQTRPNSLLEDSPGEVARVFEEAYKRRGVLSAYPDIYTSVEANEAAANFLKRKIREVVRDPAVADLLTPKIPLGCKRMCYVDGYHEAFNLPHVKLVDISATSIDKFTGCGIRVDGIEYPADLVVYATGYDAITGSILSIDIRGRNNRALRDDWRDGPRSYLGLGIHGYPNLFPVVGPGSPSALSNVVMSIEQQTEWITRCISFLEQRSHSTIEASEAAQDAWARRVNETVPAVFTQPSCNSWYLGSNVPGKPRNFSLFYGFSVYSELCQQVAERGYEGFVIAG